MPDLPGSSSGDVSQELIRINNFCMKRGESDIHFWSRALMLSVPPAGPVATFVVENLKHVLDRAERGEFVMKHIGPRLGAMRDQRTPEQRLHDSINPEFSLERIKRHNGVDPAVRPPPLEREPWVPDTAVFTTSFVFLSSAEREPCGALRKAVETLFDKISERYKHFHPADRHHGRLPEEMWTKAMKAGLEKQVARAEQVEYEDSSSDASYELLLVWRDQLIIMAERLRNHQKLYLALDPRDTVAAGHLVTWLDNTPPDADSFFVPLHTAHSLARISHRSAQRYGVSGVRSSDGGLEFGQTRRRRRW